MSEYLIDTENVGRDWVPYLEVAGKRDRFVLFYTRVSPAINLSILNQIINCPAKMECVPCYTGPNALDFQLITELGYRISKHPTTDYIVLTRDAGFDAAVKYWNDKGFSVKRIAPQHGMTPINEKEVTTTKTAAPGGQDSDLDATGSERETLSANIACHDTYLEKLKGHGVDDEHLCRIVDILMESMKLDNNLRRADAYKRICKVFGHTPGLTLYQLIKEPIKEISDNGPYPI